MGSCIVCDVGISCNARAPPHSYHASSVASVCAVDNIEMDATGALTGGSIPLPFTSGDVCEDARELSATKVVGGRTVGCGRSPGGLLRISLLGTGGRSYVAGSQADRLMHDGSRLSGIASAVTLGGKVVLASPDSPGLLVCDAA